ncbi:gas vesicle protein [Streptomyces lydicamycinicus]|uniref:Gas vesicle protein n=1 Tax=Streptomyces lydicamycinicus TaxID=1546107 RepID=A0A0P4RF25_9ACTN|nr:gas vesicle protein [Streptomyces lydicamycinicus]USA04228.1 gas vesicle protein [Streptomyces lydicamycinicus]GAO11826.1 Gas vesicle protein [Streptomyces lydicamycinicus]
MATGEEDETERVRRPSGKKTAKKTVKKTARSAGSVRAGHRGSESDGEPPRAGRRVSASRAMRYAADQLKELLGRAPESVSAVQPTEDGWQADVEVLELERVPGTTSVMATYRVMLDKEGELVAYERTRRYTRGQIDRR